MRNLYTFKYYSDYKKVFCREVATNLNDAKRIAKILSSNLRKDIWVYRNQLYFGMVEYPSYLRNLQLTPFDLSFIY